MGRLISMEDAIRAIEEEWDGCCSEYPATQIIYDTTEAIERLPTIQPEITHEQAVAYLQSTGWMQEHDRQMMLDGAHRLTVHPEPYWIPVTERLPKSKEEDLEYPTVLVCFDNGDVGTACFYESTREWGCGDMYNCICYPIAWMPLPEAFKG